jgi:hypothetical protein
MEDERNALRILFEKPGQKRLLGISTYRWENNIKINLREIGWGDIDWIHLAKYRSQWMTAVNSGNFLSGCENIVFSRRTRLQGVSCFVRSIEYKGVVKIELQCVTFLCPTVQLHSPPRYFFPCFSFFLMWISLPGLDTRPVRTQTQWPWHLSACGFDLEG